MEERFSRGRFIRLGAALGVGATGASILGACGGSAEEGAVSPAIDQETPGGVKGAEEAAGGATVAQVAKGMPIARESEVAPGSAVEFTDEESEQPAVLVHLEGGDFRAYSAICTHRQCVVGYSGGQLACPCHGSVFDPANGAAVVNGPATQPLPEIPIEVRSGEVFRV